MAIASPHINAFFAFIVVILNALPQGKKPCLINRDIGNILGSSPMTVKKHLEHVFAKLGVEIHTAAAGMTISCIRQLHPRFEGEV